MEEEITENSQENNKLYSRRRKPRKLFWLLFRNTVVFWFPALIILVLIVIFSWKYPIIYRNACHEVKSLSDMQNWYDEQCYNVMYHAVNLKYTGYDYYENDKLTGAYYYLFENDQCLLILIRTKNPVPEIVDADIRGKLLKDSAHMEAVLDQFAMEVGIDQESFFEIVYPLMLSEIDYSWTQTILIWMVVIIPTVLIALVVFLGIEWVVRPYTHPNLKKLDEFGQRKEVYYEISAQLNQSNVVHKDFYYFTDDYLILDHFGDICFVRIDKVRYISKHASKDKKRRQTYRLIMSDDEKTYYDRHLRSESVVDTIMKEMVTRNARIDDRTIHVFNIPAPEMEAAENGAFSPDSTGLQAEEGYASERIEQEKAEETASIPTGEATAEAVTAVDGTESPIGIDDAEDLKIYKVRRRLRKKEEETDQVKIYKVRHRLRRDKDKHNE